MEDEAGALWTNRNSILVGEFSQAGHQRFSERDDFTRMAVAFGQNVVETPFAGGEAEWIAVQSR